MKVISYESKNDLLTTAITLVSEGYVVYTIEDKVDLYIDDVIQLFVSEYMSKDEAIKQAKRHNDVDYILVEGGH